MKSFPKPLSSNDEKEYLIRCKKGDEDAREKLIIHNLRLVAHIVKKYSLSYIDTDDLISIGTIGLIKAIDSFDNSKKVRLATYASICIENEILMTFRATKRLSKEVFLYDPIGADKEGNEINLLDIIVDKENKVIENLILDENVELLYKILDIALSEREKTIILLRYGLNNKDEVTQREIAQMLDISRSYVSRIEKKALKKLKEYFIV